MNGESGLLENVQRHAEKESELILEKRQLKQIMEERTALELPVSVNIAMPENVHHVSNTYYKLKFVSPFTNSLLKYPKFMLKLNYYSQQPILNAIR